MIQANITFDEYKLCRVKLLNDTGIVYPPKKWIGKEVNIIPVPYVVSEKIIERNKDEDGLYHLSVKVDTVLLKEVKNNRTTGRVYLPKRMMGADALVILADKIDYF